MNTPPEAEPDTSFLAPPVATPPFPWPPGEQASVLDALTATWTGAVLRPRSFYAAMPHSVSFGAALLYYLVVGVLGAGIRLFWAMLLPARDITFLDELFPGALRGSPLVEFLASPLTLLLSLYLAAGVTHLLVLALVPQQRGFGTTLRVYCFAYSPVLFGVFPYLGPVVAVVWMTVLSIIGVRETHATSGARAVAVVLIPLVLAVFCLAAAYVLLTRALGLVGTP